MALKKQTKVRKFAKFIIHETGLAGFQEEEKITKMQFSVPVFFPYFLTVFFLYSPPAGISKITNNAENV